MNFLSEPSTTKRVTHNLDFCLCYQDHSGQKTQGGSVAMTSLSVREWIKREYKIKQGETLTAISNDYNNKI